MPDDLLHQVVGPTPYSLGWLWLAVVLATVLVGWFVGIVLWTRPGRRLPDVPVLGQLRDRMIKHRHVKAVRTIGDRYRTGELDTAVACAAVNRELREFLRHATGIRAEYLQLDDIATGALAPAAPLFAQLSDARFNDASQVDAGRASADAEELIQSWT